MTAYTKYRRNSNKNVSYVSESRRRC